MDHFFCKVIGGLYFGYYGLKFIGALGTNLREIKEEYQKFVKKEKRKKEKERLAML